MTSTYEDDYDYETYERSGLAAQAISYAGDQIAEAFDDIAEAMANFDPDQVRDRVRTLCSALPTRVHELVDGFGVLCDLWARNPQADFDVLEYESFRRCDPDNWPSDPVTSDWSPVPRTGVRKGIRALHANTLQCTHTVHACGDAVRDYVGNIVGWYDSEDSPRIIDAAVHNIGYLASVVLRTADLWIRVVFDAHRKLARSQTGLRPPAYIQREARWAEIVAEIDEKFGHPRRPSSVVDTRGNLQ